MQGRNRRFMKKKVGKLLEVGITTGEAYNLLWTREKRWYFRDAVSLELACNH